MSGTYQLESMPVEIDLGPKRRADVTSDVAFVFRGVMLCAGARHVITGGRFVQLRATSRSGVVKVWPR